MERTFILLAAIAALALVTTPALADDTMAAPPAGAADGPTATGGFLAPAPEDQPTAPVARDVQDAVDAAADTVGDGMVGGTGTAGYDAGFYIRGGDFLLRINATLQARWEGWDWDDEDLAEVQNLPFAGDTSGFSLPRATLKLSGEAPCNICYYMELEFGHPGRADIINDFQNLIGLIPDGPIDVSDELLSRQSSQFPGGGLDSGNILTQLLGLGPSPLRQSYNYDVLREAWIEWCYCPAFNFRMGQVMLPSTRQMMVAPELQQFIDISLASTRTGIWMPGYTDRNRDHGFMIHGAFGCNNEFSYVATVTNGDGGDSIRNVLDHRTSDNLAYGLRLNWAFLNAIGYEEGALRQETCKWYGEVGLWAHVYYDRLDKPHVTVSDNYVYGIDLALGWGGFSFTSAYTIIEADFDELDTDVESFNWLVQLGYHIPGTAWEVAARASGYDQDAFEGILDGSVIEYAFGINYYLNGHGNKLQLDLTFVEMEEQTILWGDTYAGYNRYIGIEDNDALLLRFQWQLAL